MHSDSKKHRLYLALLFTAGDARRYVDLNRIFSVMGRSKKVVPDPTYFLLEATKFQKLDVRFCPCCGGNVEI